MPRVHLMLLALLPVGYLAGSIPFGLIIALARGVDPRKSGSGNIGATNIGRLLGGRYFALTLALDILKGFLPMLAATLMVRWTGAAERPLLYLLWLLVGFAAICGHMFSLFMGFKGGKGVATSAGVVLGLYPYYTLPLLVGLAVWAVLFAIWRYVSVASMGASLAFPVAYLLIGLWRSWPVLGAQWPLLLFAWLVPVMIIYKHRGNIVRLLAGTELRSGRGGGATTTSRSA